MAGKRENPSFSRQISSSLAKRLKPPPSESNAVAAAADNDDRQEQFNKPTAQNSSMVVVNNLSRDCSVLNLKSRLEIYGSISRIRIDQGAGYVTFRSKDSAEASIIASLDLGITVDSQKVEVSWSNDHFPRWREGVEKKSLTSRLLRPEIPLRKHGRGNKLSSSSSSSSTTRNPRNARDEPFKGREIVAYDDLL